MDDYISKSDLAFYVVKEKKKKLTALYQKIKSSCNFIFALFIYSFKKQKGFLTTNLWHYAFDKIIVFYRTLSTRRGINFLKIKDLEKIKYLYFPLHYEPELVLLVQSQDYLDQLNVIMNISRNLPLNTQLAVKDHPLMFGRRKPDFYKTILGIPNVVLVDSTENSIEIIKLSFGVITIIGSVGMEAFFHNKPAITLSNAFYNFIPSVKKVESFHEISNEVLNFENYKFDLNEKLILIETIKELSIAINLNQLIQKLDLGKINNSEKVELDDFIDFLQENIFKKIGNND